MSGELLPSNILSKRKMEKFRRRKRLAESIRRHVESGGEHISKRVRIKLDKEKLKQNLANGVKFCIDCSFEKDLSQKEISKLAQQFCRTYGANKKATVPFSMHLVNFNSSGPLAECCRRKCCGFDNYQIGFHAESPTEVFKDQKIIYLSPDAPDPLIEVEKDVVYVVGGLIDESIEKGRSLDKATNLNVSAARLPIDEFAPADWNPQNRVKASALCINTLVEILLDVMHIKDWRQAFDKHLPHRHRTTTPARLEGS
ncbi:unnamed protein product [Hymenolepis diminuta]|uniref:SAM-dependent MTase TRM10-type domain-containing protein n=2 Tax=Hymenolepis diminuta TaxID=6216 RepID=A0A564YUT0_HYMDI|nr:unnamed protein product [Hymenolepis diminuta]